MQAIASVLDVSQHQKLEASLREQVKQRDRFLANLSHELRGPLNAILTAALVLDRSASRSSEVVKPCQVIRQQSSQMSLLLDDLLNVARLTQGKIKLRLEVIDLIEACQESIAAVQPMLASHEHQLQIDFPTEPIWIKADRVRILQVIGNLLRNAIWGYTKIVQAMRRLGHKISCQTVKNVLVEAGLGPEPHDHPDTWSDFLKRHAETMWQCELCEHCVHSHRNNS